MEVFPPHKTCPYYFYFFIMFAMCSVQCTLHNLLSYKLCLFFHSFVYLFFMFIIDYFRNCFLFLPIRIICNNSKMGITHLMIQLTNLRSAKRSVSVSRLYFIFFFIANSSPLTHCFKWPYLHRICDADYYYYFIPEDLFLLS